MKADLLSVLEAAYAPAQKDSEWMQGALKALGPHIDQGLGVFGHSFVHTPRGFSRGPLGAATKVTKSTLRATDELFALTERMPAAEGRELLSRLYPRVPTVGWFNDLARKGPALFEQLPSPTRSGAGDALGIVASDPSGRGCVFFALASKRRTLAAPSRAAWTRVAAHLAMGYRLACHPNPAVDAVLLPSGKLEHAEAMASGRDDRDALSSATRAIDRALGRLRRTDPDEALKLWTGLVQGRWSLVEQFDHDGRRYVVAKRNSPNVSAWSTLTAAEAQVVAYAAEGQPHKFIAYELGMSTSSVAAHLARAGRKVGAASRLALVTAYRVMKAGNLEARAR